MGRRKSRSSKSQRAKSKPEPSPEPSEQTDTENSPVGFKYIEIGSTDKDERDINWGYNESQAPRAYQTPMDMLKAAAIAEAAEEARQEVRKRYREAERAERKDLVSKLQHPSPFWAVLGFLRKWTALGGVFFLGATWTMIQIDEYALAAVLLAIGMFAFSVQIYDWNGIENHRKATLVLKGFAAFLIVGSLGFFGAVIVKKKGIKPWSNLISKEVRPAPIPSPVTLIRNSGSIFFATYPQPFMYELGDDSLVPIALDLAVAITNNRGTATRITEYTAEIQTRDGAWHRLISLPMSPPRTIFFLNRFDIRRGMKCQLDPPAFDTVADRREIGVGETIEGQMFFELPAELRYETVSYGKLKVTTKNIQSETSEAIFDDPGTPSVTGAGQINGGFTWCPGEPNQAIDLSRRLIRPLQE